MEKKQDEEEEEGDTACIYCDKPWGVIIWNGLYDDERVSIYLCDRCNRHLERPDTRELQALRIVSQRDCTDLASGGQSFFDRKSLSALSVVLDEDNGKDVEKALEWKARECARCEKEYLARTWVTDDEVECDYEDCAEEDSYCRDCMLKVDGKFYHYTFCEPIEWNLLNAFTGFPFEGGRNYTGCVSDVIEELGYNWERLGEADDVIGVISFRNFRDDVYFVYDAWLYDSVDNNRGQTFANTLPQGICQALWDYQQECDIEGFYELDREFFFG